MRTIALVLLAAACTGSSGPDGVSREETRVFSVVPDMTDVLFVIDDSPAMASAHDSLAINARKMMTLLQELAGPADLQVAVTTTDGTGALVGTSCLAPGARWLRYAWKPNGELLRNFDGTAEDAFACMTDVGSAGPSVRQPLESMRRALTDHLGFARANARMYVVIIASGDDCSLREGASPADPFACTEETITCDESDLRALGDKHHCRARTGSPLVRDVGEYVDFLGTLGANRAAIGAVIGPAEPFTIVDGPRLAPSCASAAPSLRIAELAAAFPHGSTTSSLCAADFSDVLVGLTGFGGEPGDYACFDTPVTDDCIVTLTREGASAEIVRACDPFAYATPCWTLRDDQGCQHVAVDFGEGPIPAAVIRATCSVE
jgi:hypothetical protein